MSWTCQGVLERDNIGHVMHGIRRHPSLRWTFPNKLQLEPQKRNAINVKRNGKEQQTNAEEGTARITEKASKIEDGESTCSYT